MSKPINAIKGKISSLREFADKTRFKIMGLAAENDGYIQEAAKIIIALVIGVMLLVFLVALFKGNIFPSVQQKLNGMFTYDG